MARGYVVVEGQGDQLAVVNLLSRLWRDLSLPELHWAQPIRGKNLHSSEGLRRYAEYVRHQRGASALLVLRDEDDECPKHRGPEAAAWLQELELPFPAAVVLAHREYESLFLPCLVAIAGKPLDTAEGGVSRAGLREGTSFVGDPERKRGVKEWLSRHMASGKRYKPTMDQLPMTRMVEFPLVRGSGLPWFGTLERALRFLATHCDRPGQVYPSPP